VIILGVPIFTNGVWISGSGSADGNAATCTAAKLSRAANRVKCISKMIDDVNNYCPRKKECDG
jgi:hypothetical protein